MDIKPFEITLNDLLKRDDLRMFCPRFILKNAYNKTAREMRLSKAAEYRRPFMLDPVMEMAINSTGHVAIITRPGNKVDVTRWPLRLSVSLKVLVIGLGVSHEFSRDRRTMQD